MTARIKVQVTLVVKNPPANTGDARDMARAPGVGNGNPLQYSCLENSTPWSEEPGELQSIGSQRVGHNCTHTHTLQLSRR